MVLNFFSKTYYFFNNAKNYNNCITGKCRFLIKKSCAFSLKGLNFAAENQNK